VFAQQNIPPAVPPLEVDSSPVCKTCTSMATWLEKYVEVMTKLIALLDQEPQFLSDSIRVPAAWEMFIRRLFTENMLTTALIPAKTALVTSLRTLPDTFFAFSYLFSSKSVMRDSQIFDEIERQIQKKAFAMSVARSYFRPVSKAKLEQIDILLRELWYIELRRPPNETERFNFQVTWKHNWAMLSKFYRINEIYRDLYAFRFFTTYFADIGSIDYVSISNPNDQFAPLLENETTVQVVQLLQNFVNDRRYRGMDGWRRSAVENTFSLSVVKFILHVWAIETEYRCSRGKTNVCDGLKEVRRTWWETMQSNWWNGVALSQQTFLDAMARLKGEFRGNASTQEKAAAQQRKQALLRSQWWSWPRSKEFDYDKDWIKINKENTTQGNKLWWSPMVKSMIEAEERKTRLGQTHSDGNVITVVEQRATLWSVIPEWEGTRLKQKKYNSSAEREVYFTTLIDEYVKNTMVRPLLQEDQILLLSANTKRIADEMVLSLQSTFTSLFELQAELQLHAMSTDWSQVSYLFPQLSMYVSQWAQMIWDKTSRKPWDGTIVTGMWEICEAQCPTLPNKKCYYYKN
jgi:hypothetical protein